MKDRQRNILNAIIKHFIDTAEPVGSNTLIVNYNFRFSPATMRKEMYDLELAGLISQPHTSAGRIPTDKGYRIYLEEMEEKNQSLIEEKVLKEIHQLQKEYFLNKVYHSIHDGVSLLAKATNNVSFATLPNKRTFYLGMSHILKQPEFAQDALAAARVLEVIENNNNFLHILNTIDIEPGEVKCFIGNENIIDEIKSTSMIVAKYTIQDKPQYFGVLGPTRMNHPYNKIMVKELLKIITN
jgi:heat-inducible transcriptional repressor